MSSDAIERAKALIDRIEGSLPPDPKLNNYVAALKSAIEEVEADSAQSVETLAKFEEAYNKLTSPANRIGVFLKWTDENLASVALGDTEYITTVDPNIETALLVPGARVRLNDAYAVVGLTDHASTGALIKVSAVQDDGRLRVGSDMPGSDGRFVLRGQALESVRIETGDEVRLDATGRIALEHFAKSENRDYFFEDVPVLPWEKIGGQEEAIRLIRETIEQPLLHPEIFEKFKKKPIKGILLYGPPGCGKTLIGKATAHNLTKEYSKQVGHEVKEYFMAISGPKILNMWLGETERMVRDIFRTAREKAKEGRLVFIFMDEAESILRTRSSGRWLNISNTVVPQFCAELDGLVSLENVVLMLTSNRPDYIDPAVLRPERIDRKIKINRPDRDASRDIFSIYLDPELPIDPALASKHKCDLEAARQELIEGAVNALWDKSKETEFLKISYRNGSSETLYWSDLVSGALIKSSVDRAKDLAIRRAVADPNADHGISLDDLQLAIKAEFKENEIFPKSDIQEDWLKLLDVEPESVVSVKPVSNSFGEGFVRKNVL